MSTTNIEDLKKQLQNLEERVSRLEQSSHSLATKSSGKETAVREFLIEKHPSSDLDKTIVIAYYVEHQRNTSPFSVRDVEDMFREAKETLPRNINDAINRNIAKGFIMKSREKKDGLISWTLTSTGEKFVESYPGKAE